MVQYRPEGRADRYALLNHPITRKEYDEAVQIARDEGLWRFDTRRARRRLLV